MSEMALVGCMFGGLLLLIFAGFHIYVALGLVTVGGVWAFSGSFDLAMTLLSTTLVEALREYVFAVIPLFVLMGEFLARSGAAKDLYQVMNKAFRKLPGRLAVATVAGNTVFAAAVGVSIASAATFTRIAYPEMKQQGYNDSVSLGCIAGSACLGMLIPPSTLLIIYGMLTEMSIGKLFAAALIPGLALATLFAIYVMGLAVFKPELLGEGKRGETNNKEDKQLTHVEYIGGLGTISVIFLVLGGIWFGWFTPTEAAGFGALLGFLLAMVKGLKKNEIVEAILHTGRISAPLLILLIFGSFYGRLLAFGGVIDLVDSVISGWGLTPAMLLVVMVCVWFIMGMFIDSNSIILLSIPIFAPIAIAAGYEPLQFAIIAILAIEAGILTPPLGLCVYTVKAALDDPKVTLGQIFLGAAPYWIMLLILIILLVQVPAVTGYLPSIM
ncbi:TRAP transporter large permease [Pseudovibrio sp. Tun.PSC04-5.I4]|uniref:TRAP transporter large permease n=1 Tax=Pseudovibrio sp. Tun.PSC04-5.I4 TaxID=1798213 RepID=UPI00088C0DC0|nr:TRAP transporter large permease [Pseudovibrio sp. Tun.PSC04-5.I4]SDQ74621.1 TRAP transporter, DctM subunit [Pseudovibrio sp. Tun.PSC04-5.I4]